MKKLLYIIITLLLFTSCEEYAKQAEEAKKTRIQNKKEKQLTPDTTYYARNMQNVEFDGHLYVVYTEKNGGGFGAAMVHSPNCECNE